MNSLPYKQHFGKSVLSKRNIYRLIRIAILSIGASVAPALGTCTAQSSAPREWSDVSGNNKVKATLVEFKDGVVYLKTPEGKTLKIQAKRLSQADQDYLSGGINPFQEIASDDSSANNASDASSKDIEPSNWNKNLKIDWDDVEELDRSYDGEWKLELPKKSELDFTPKRASLNKKTNFHEDIRRLEINPLAQRGVAGYTVTFSVPKPLSRLALVDLVSGKAIHTSPVEADMCPIALLNDGSSVIMGGTSREGGAYETADQLQLWKVSAKKITRSKSWIPFPDEADNFGRKGNAHILEAIPLANNKLILLGTSGHLVCIDALTRKPYWHSKLSQSFAIDASIDRSLLAIVDGHSVLIVDAQTGKTKCEQAFDDKPHVAFPKVRFSPSGTRLMVTFGSEIRVLDLVKGEWIHKCNFVGGLLATNMLSYPHDDYALLENRLLVHIPSQIKVCEYRNASRLVSLGGTCFVASQGGDSGSIMPIKLPHPEAIKMLGQAIKDPSVFLIHPGVAVSINASGANLWANEVANSLEQAAIKAGYKVTDNSPITIVATITGPREEAVSYIARGAYIAKVYQSTIKLTWQGKDLWSSTANNIPGFLQTSRGKSIQETLDELGKTPNLSIFPNAQFPKLMQTPTEGNKGGSEALMFANFGIQGIAK